MPTEPETRGGVRALGLLSGGLDSALSASLLQELGVVVSGVHFKTGFERHDRLDGSPAEPGGTLEFTSAVGAPVEEVDVVSEYLRDVVLHPKYGYGAAMNPCIDCRIFMLRRAGGMARERGADVVFTGEVLGQDSFSQKRASLLQIEAESGLAGRLLRPLSARHLSATLVEEQGRIPRERLGRLQGRSRKDQVLMAEARGIRPSLMRSSGCCLLADPSFARRLRDLLSHRDPGSLREEDILLLRVGRHFRLAHDLKLILGRDARESRWLDAQAGARWRCQVADGKGALGLAEGSGLTSRVEAVAALAARYSRHREEPAVLVRLWNGKEELNCRVPPCADSKSRLL